MVSRLLLFLIQPSAHKMTPVMATEVSSTRQEEKRMPEIVCQQRTETIQGWRIAADAARITDENTSSENCKHTEPLGPPLGTRKNRPSTGKCQRRYVGFSRVLLAFSFMDSEE